MIEIPGRLLEFINGVHFVVCAGLVIFLAAYMARKCLTRGFKITPELKLGWALTIFATGDTIIRGTVWYSRHLANQILAGSPGDVAAVVNGAVWPGTFTAITAAGTILGCWGGLCALRVVTPRESGEWPWLLVLTVALFGSMILAL